MFKTKTGYYLCLFNELVPQPIKWACFLFSGTDLSGIAKIKNKNTVHQTIFVKKFSNARSLKCFVLFHNFIRSNKVLLYNSKTDTVPRSLTERLLFVVSLFLSVHFVSLTNSTIDWFVISHYHTCHIDYDLTFWSLTNFLTSIQKVIYVVDCCKFYICQFLTVVNFTVVNKIFLSLTNGTKH